MLMQYIKTEENEPIGCVVAIADEAGGTFSVGWSACNTKLDSFKREESVDRAIDRAEAALRGRNVFRFPDGRPKYPSHIKDALIRFIDRATLYYKDKSYDGGFDI